jgi:hypothetical protein
MKQLPFSSTSVLIRAWAFLSTRTRSIYTSELCGNGLPTPCPIQSGFWAKFEVCSGTTSQDGKCETIKKEPIFSGSNGGRDRDRTCDPYHVKEARGIEAVGNQGICVPICGNSGGCSKDVPPSVVAYDQRALPNLAFRAAVSNGSQGPNQG